MHLNCSRCPIWSLTVWFIQYPISGCLGQSSKIFRKYQKYLKYLGNIRNIKNIFGNILWQYFWYVSQLSIPGLQRTCTWWTASRRRRRSRRWGATLSPGTSTFTQGGHKLYNIYIYVWYLYQVQIYLYLRKIYFDQGKCICIGEKYIFLRYKYICLREKYICLSENIFVSGKKYICLR